MSTHRKRVLVPRLPSLRKAAHSPNSNGYVAETEETSGEDGSRSTLPQKGSSVGMTGMSRGEVGVFPAANTDVEANSNPPQLQPHPDHKDFMGRPQWIPPSDSGDQYLKPRDGRLALLKVQGTDGSHHPHDHVTWKRGIIIDQTPPILKLVNWCTKSVPGLYSQSANPQHIQGQVSHSAAQGQGDDSNSGNVRRGFLTREWRKKYFSRDRQTLYLKWIPTCLGLLILLTVPMSLEGQIRNNGFYDPIRYRYWGYSKVARNRSEDRPDVTQQAAPPESDALLGKRMESHHFAEATQNTTSLPEQPQAGKDPKPERIEESNDESDQDFDDLPARYLRPRYLCFLREDVGYDVVKVKNWIDKDGEEANLEYIFVSFTRKHFETSEEKGRNDLLQIAENAARQAGVPAFWLDFECMPKDVLEEDINRICDVVRGAHSLVVALCPPPAGKKAKLSTGVLLRQWGSQLWTLPEVLLSSSEHKIAIYIQGKVEPEKLAKRNFALRAWKDAKAVRQLIDHYESSLILTPLELVTIALQCLQSRLTEMLRTGYRQYSPGDMSYALMGLLRRRPKVNRTDTDFEAFARLSLANDSNMLLERLICMLPLKRGLPWHEMTDAWGVRLWDIYPTCQIAGIAEYQTVILDGAFGATIRWKSLAPVACIKRNTVARTILKFCVRLAPLYFVIGVAALASGASQHIPGGQVNPTTVIGIIFFIFAMIIILASPYLLLITYRGKFWGTQAWFFGIEGQLPIGTIEEYLFGINLGRLRWSSNGSILSRHHISTKQDALEGECEALAPNPAQKQQFQTTENGSRHPNDLAGQHEAPRPDAEEIQQVQTMQNYPTRPSPVTGEYEVSRHTTALPQPSTTTQNDRQRLFTLVDTYTMTVTLFEAARPPVAVLVCGREGGMQRAVLCSYDWRTQTFCRETVLRMKTMAVDKMFRVDRFRFSLDDGLQYRASTPATNIREACSGAAQ